MLGSWLGSIGGLNIGTNEGIKLGFSDRKVVGTTLGAVVGFPFGTYVGSNLGYLEGSTDRAMYGKFEGLLDYWMDLNSEQMKVLN